MSTQTVFSLRKEAKYLEGTEKINKLNEGFHIADNLYQSDPSDEWVQKAYAWILIDICKYYSSIGNTVQGIKHYHQLTAIKFDDFDDIIEKQKDLLKTKFNANYSTIKKAEDLSKNGNHVQALKIFTDLITRNQLTQENHESYGWVIYRYIKNKESELTSIQVRTHLSDYMLLANERPSMLHSMILNFAYHYSKDHPDFNLYKFLKLWNPRNLRDEDKSTQRYNDKEIPSLISRVLRVFIDKNYDFDIDFLLDNIEINWSNDKANKELILNLLREPYFWRIYHLKKENNIPDLWKMFDNYNVIFSGYDKSKWNSDILSLAERYMQETNEWRFLDFFKEWKPENFRDEDWLEVKKDENTYKPLAIKCLKKAFGIFKKQQFEQSTSGWLINSYEIAAAKFPKDEWIKREQALLLIHNNKLEKSIEIYKSLVLKLGDKAYIWHEFSTCFKDNKDLKIGMLSKAIQIERNEDFLGDIHLELAETLIDNNLFEKAIIELSIYKKHRDKKDWKVSDVYTILHNKTSNHSTTLKDNRILYHQYIPFAEEFAYQDIPWTELILVDIWKNDKNKERCNFSDSNNIELSVSRRRFNILRKANIGNIFKFKLHQEEQEAEQQTKTASWMSSYLKPKITYRYIPILAEKSDKSNWSILDDEFAVIDYINRDKKVLHAITSNHKEIFFKADIRKYRLNDFIQGKKFTSRRKDQIRTELKNIKIIDPTIGIEQFQKVIAIVDHVNHPKQLFHFVASNTIHGIVKFRETDLRPKEGTFLELSIAQKTNKKHNKLMFKPLEIKETEKVNDKLLKTIKGTLNVKFKLDGITKDFFDLDEEQIFVIKPDFGFIDDFYVPKYILEKYEIDSDCNVIAKAIFSSGKWKIIDIAY